MQRPADVFCGAGSIGFGVKKIVSGTSMHLAFWKDGSDEHMLMLERTVEVIDLPGEVRAAHFAHIGLCSKGY